MKRKTLESQKSSMPIIRIAPVCNGKIYVTPHTLNNKEQVHMDLPIMENVEYVSTKSDKMAHKVKEKYHLHIQSEASPRFCVQHKSATTDNATVYLYVLPLKREDEIQFHNGKFVDAEHIQTHHEQYSHNLLKESDLLSMAAELWNDYFQATT